MRLRNYPCRRNGCLICKYIKVGNHFCSTQTRRKFRIRQELNCKSTHVIYLVTCLNCKEQYVGETGQNLSIRFNKHRSDIEKGKRSTGLSKHFLNGNCDGSSHTPKITMKFKLLIKSPIRKEEDVRNIFGWLNSKHFIQMEEKE